MEDSFDKINIRIASFGQVLNQIILIDNKETLEKVDSDTWQLDQYRACLEFDTFIQDYPKTYKKYLNDFLISYTAIRMGFEKFLKLKDPFYSEKRKLFDIVYLTIDFVIEHLTGLIGDKAQPPKKNEPSLVRAKAFCIALIQQAGKKNFLKGAELRRNDIMKFAEKTWGRNGRTIYNECLNIITEQNPINKCYRGDYPKEYELGFKMFKEMYPD